MFLLGNQNIVPGTLECFCEFLCNNSFLPTIELLSADKFEILITSDLTMIAFRMIPAEECVHQPIAGLYEDTPDLMAGPFQ